MAAQGRVTRGRGRRRSPNPERLFPAQQTTFDAELSASLAEVPDGPAENKGVARAAPSPSILTRRHDGADEVVTSRSARSRATGSRHHCLPANPALRSGRTSRPSAWTTAISSAHRPRPP
jgi:hypothetical protein